MASTGRSSGSASALKPQSARSREDAAVAINTMLAKLRRLPHRYYTSEDPAYYQLADIFVFALEHRGLEQVFPRTRSPIPDWRVHRPTIRGSTFVTGVIEGAPARAGRRSLRRRNPVGGRSPVSAGRLLPRQSWIDPSRLRSAAPRALAPIAIPVSPADLRPNEMFLRGLRRARASS